VTSADFVAAAFLAMMVFGLDGGAGSNS
jgi:hypothetical protein